MGSGCTFPYPGVLATVRTRVAMRGQPALLFAGIVQLRNSESNSRKPQKEYSILQAAGTCYQRFLQNK